MNETEFTCDRMGLCLAVGVKEREVVKDESLVLSQSHCKNSDCSQKQGRNEKEFYLRGWWVWFWILGPGAKTKKWKWYLSFHYVHEKENMEMKVERLKQNEYKNGKRTTEESRERTRKRQRHWYKGMINCYQTWLLMNQEFRLSDCLLWVLDYPFDS